MELFLQKIHHWYSKNKRSLPWRTTSDPYKIWLSEIVLQQTRVEQGKNYYLKFIERFPDVRSLANAEEDEVLKLWQGLGYYSRARNLHQTAKFVAENLNGKFPANYNELLKLKGIGEYTAAAISSIAFNLPCPTVDGNVYRVLSRYFGIKTAIDSTQGKKEFQELAQLLIPEKNPGSHNQALMEFGALHCTPKSPNCASCPLKENCFAYTKKIVTALPVKQKKSKQKTRFFYYYYIDFGQFTFLEKRIKSDIWRNLYQFPLWETENKLSESEILNLIPPFLNEDCNFNIKNISNTKKHVLSHQVIYARLIHTEIKNSSCLNNGYIKLNKKDISKFAVSRLVDKFIQQLITK